MSRLAVISQPTYLPWLGYFDLIDQADVFVFLDHVQLERQSWQTRNRIRTSQGLQWLSIPLHAHLGQSLVETEVVPDKTFPAHHLKAIAQNYRKAPHFEAHYPELESLLGHPPGTLAGLNITLIRWLCRQLGMQQAFLRSSELSPMGKRSVMLAGLLDQVQATAYLSPEGSAGYLREERDAFGPLPIQLHQYEHPVYRQMWEPFMPYACSLDLLFNEGPRALEIIRSGRRPARPL